MKQKFFSTLVNSFTALPFGSIRTSKSSSRQADKKADSRVMAGLHVRFSCEAGQQRVNKIGNRTVVNYLKPLKWFS